MAHEGTTGFVDKEDGGYERNKWQHILCCSNLPYVTNNRQQHRSNQFQPWF